MASRRKVASSLLGDIPVKRKVQKIAASTTPGSSRQADTLTKGRDSADAIVVDDVPETVTSRSLVSKPKKSTVEKQVTKSTGVPSVGGKGGSRITHDGVVLRNHQFSKEAATDDGVRFTPKIVDGNGEPVHISSLGCQDAYVASMLSNVVLQGDVTKVKEIGDSGMVLNDMWKDVYNLVVKMSVVPEANKKIDEENEEILEHQEKQISELEHKLGVAELDRDSLKVSVESCESEITRLKKVCAEWEEKMKEMEKMKAETEAENIKLKAELATSEGSLKSARDEVAATQAKLDQAVADADDECDRARSVVQILDGVLKAHMSKCPGLGDELIAAKESFANEAGDADTEAGIETPVVDKDKAVV